MPKISPIQYRTLVKILVAEGAVVGGQEGSHIQLIKPVAKRRLVVPTYRQIPTFIILNNLKLADISRERYFELLKKNS